MARAAEADSVRVPPQPRSARPPSLSHLRGLERRPLARLSSRGIRRRAPTRETRSGHHQGRTSAGGPPAPPTITHGPSVRGAASDAPRARQVSRTTSQAHALASRRTRRPQEASAGGCARVPQAPTTQGVEPDFFFWRAAGARRCSRAGRLREGKRPGQKSSCWPRASRLGVMIKPAAEAGGQPARGRGVASERRVAGTWPASGGVRTI